MNALCRALALLTLSVSIRRISAWPGLEISGAKRPDDSRGRDRRQLMSSRSGRILALPPRKSGFLGAMRCNNPICTLAPSIYVLLPEPTFDACHIYSGDPKGLIPFVACA